jgi:hypothetical protein
MKLMAVHETKESLISIEDDEASQQHPAPRIKFLQRHCGDQGLPATQRESRRRYRRDRIGLRDRAPSVGAVHDSGDAGASAEHVIVFYRTARRARPTSYRDLQSHQDSLATGAPPTLLPR